MELGELIEELEKIEHIIGSAAEVFLYMQGDEIELYGVDVRKIEEDKHQVVIKGRR